MQQPPATKRKRPWYARSTNGVRALALECGAYFWLRLRSSRGAKTRAMSAVAGPTSVRRWCAHPLFACVLVGQIDAYAGCDYQLPDVSGDLSPYRTSCSLCLDSSRERLYITNGGQVTAVDLRRRCVMFKVPCSFNTCLAVNGEQQFLYTSSSDGIGRRCSKTGIQLARPHGHVPGRVLAMMWHETQNRLLLISAFGLHVADAWLTDVQLVIPGYFENIMAVHSSLDKIWLHGMQIDRLLSYSLTSQQSLGHSKVHHLLSGITSMAYHALSNSLLLAADHKLWAVPLVGTQLVYKRPYPIHLSPDFWVCNVDVDNKTGAAICLGTWPNTYDTRVRLLRCDEIMNAVARPQACGDDPVPHT